MNLPLLQYNESLEAHRHWLQHAEFTWKIDPTSPAVRSTKGLQIVVLAARTRIPRAELAAQLIK